MISDPIDPFDHNGLIRSSPITDPPSLFSYILYNNNISYLEFRIKNHFFDFS